MAWNNICDDDRIYELSDYYRRFFAFGYTWKDIKRYNEALFKQDTKKLYSMCKCNHSGKCPICCILHLDTVYSGIRDRIALKHKGMPKYKKEFEKISKT